jgi:hypothetical protein
LLTSPRSVRPLVETRHEVAVATPAWFRDPVEAVGNRWIRAGVENDDPEMLAVQVARQALHGAGRDRFVVERCEWAPLRYTQMSKVALTRPKPIQTAEGEISVAMPHVRNTAEHFVSRVIPDTKAVIRTRRLEALIIGGSVRGYRIGISRSLGRRGRAWSCLEDHCQSNLSRIA